MIFTEIFVFNFKKSSFLMKTKSALPTKNTTEIREESVESDRRIGATMLVTGTFESRRKGA